MKILLPDYVKTVIFAIESAGFEAYAVGGAVRDLLLGRTPCDYDVASSAPPEEIHRVFPHVADTGLAFGTVTVVLEGHALEVTRYRTESGYGDARHPDEVAPARDITEDLSRRDFTVNAMACHPRRGLLDPFGGREDLERRCIRAVGDPAVRFREDALRILRAFRFCSQLDFSLEPATREAALSLCPALARVSAERVASEVEKTLMGRRPEQLSELLAAGGLLPFGLPQAKEKLSSFSLLPEDITIRFAALCFACGVPAEEACRILKRSKERRRSAEALLASWQAPLPRSRGQIKRLLSPLRPELWAPSLLARGVLTGEDTAPAAALAEDILEKKEPYRLCDLAVSGDDLKEHGVSGRKTGCVLEALLCRVTDDPSLNRRETLLGLLPGIREALGAPPAGRNDPD